MNDSRGSTADGIWIGLCVLLVLLLALAGGFVWIQRQFAARAVAAAEMARAAEQENRMQAQLALAAAEQARSDAARQVVDASQAPSADVASAPVQPVVPEVYLNQDLWRNVESLEDAAPDAKVFTIDTQTGDIRFGDGEHGARPPDGPATIQAEYRIGRGGTITVYLPDSDLQQCRLRAAWLTDGTLRLEVSDLKRDD